MAFIQKHRKQLKSPKPRPLENQENGQMHRRLWGSKITAGTVTAFGAWAALKASTAMGMLGMSLLACSPSPEKSPSLQTSYEGEAMNQEESQQEKAVQEASNEAPGLEGKALSDIAQKNLETYLEKLKPHSQWQVKPTLFHATGPKWELTSWVFLRAYEEAPKDAPKGHAGRMPLDKRYYVADKTGQLVAKDDWLVLEQILLEQGIQDPQRREAPHRGALYFAEFCQYLRRASIGQSILTAFQLEHGNYPLTDPPLAVPAFSEDEKGLVLSYFTMGSAGGGRERIAPEYEHCQLRFEKGRLQGFECKVL